MAFPTKFKDLIEMGAGEVEPPRHVCLQYAVCGIETHSCGWHGWTLGGAWSAVGPADEDPHDRLVEGAYQQRCPRCYRRVILVGVEAWFGPEDRPAPTRAYDVVPAKYVDDPDRLLAEEYLPLGPVRTRWADRKPGADDWHEHCEICLDAAFSDEPHDQQEGISDVSLGLLRMLAPDREGGRAVGP